MLVFIFTPNDIQAQQQLTAERLFAPDRITDIQIELARADWDVALVDYSMPNFNGKSALALIRQQITEIPCIILSGAVGEAKA